MKSVSELGRGPWLGFLLVLVGSVALAQPARAPEDPAAAPGVGAAASPESPAVPKAQAPAGVAERDLAGAAIRPADALGASWSEEKPVDELGFGWVLVRTLIVLGLVLAIIYLTLNFGLRRLMGIKGLPGGHASVVSVLEKVPLDQKRSLFVVKAAGEYLLVGGGDGALSLLSKLDPAEIERLQRERPAAALALSPFLQKLLTRRGGSPPPTL